MFAHFHDALLLAQNADAWTNTFFGLDKEERFPLLVIALGCGTGVILGLAGIVYSALDSMHRRRLEFGLKQELVERGMSADEIAKIISAAPAQDEAVASWIASWGKKKSC